MPDPITHLIAGFRSFRAKYYEQRPERFRPLVDQGQQPPVLMIACSDSRIDPAIVLGAEPGELFVVRNVANLVPPYQPDGHYHGTSAALEFAVKHLGVTDIVVMGHSQCGGIQALLSSDLSDGSEFLGPWVSIARNPHVEALAGTASAAHDCSAFEQASIRGSIDNLMTFPWVRERVEAKTLGLHGWWLHLTEGELWALDRQNGQFHAIV